MSFKIIIADFYPLSATNPIFPFNNLMISSAKKLS